MTEALSGGASIPLRARSPMLVGSKQDPVTPASQVPAAPESPTLRSVIDMHQGSSSSPSLAAEAARLMHSGASASPKARRCSPAESRREHASTRMAGNSP